MKYYIKILTRYIWRGILKTPSKSIGNNLKIKKGEIVMKLLKKVLVPILVIALMLVAVCGCQTTSSGETAPADSASETTAADAAATDDAATDTSKQEVMIGLSLNASDASMNALADTMQAYYDDWNAAGNTPSVTFRVVNAEGNLDTQISDIDSLITMGADVIFSSAVDSVGIVPAIQRAREAGVKCIELRGIDPSEVDVTLDMSDKTLVDKALVWWHDFMDSNPDLVIKAGAIHGMASQTGSLVRIDGVVEDLEANYPDRFELLATNYADWDTGKAMAITEDWLQSYPDMNCIISAGAMEALGAVNAVAAAGGDMEEWVFTTTDFNADAASMFKKGQLDMTVGINAVALAESFAQLCLDVATGNFEGDVFTIPDSIYQIIDKNNFEEVLSNWAGAEEW
jgi:ABC-type sugar transport system substrate-binding protein